MGKTAAKCVNKDAALQRLASSLHAPWPETAARKEAGLREQGDRKATNTAQGVHGSFQKKGLRMRRNCADKQYSYSDPSRVELLTLRFGWNLGDESSVILSVVNFKMLPCRYCGLYVCIYLNPHSRAGGLMGIHTSGVFPSHLKGE